MWVVAAFLMCAPWYGKCTAASPEHAVFTLPPQATQQLCREAGYDYVVAMQREMGYAWAFDLDCERAI